LLDQKPDELAGPRQLAGLGADGKALSPMLAVEDMVAVALQVGSGQVGQAFYALLLEKREKTAGSGQVAVHCARREVAHPQILAKTTLP
jgi:hypothetical protein